jgi:hypothetical protein
LLGVGTAQDILYHRPILSSDIHLFIRVIPVVPHPKQSHLRWYISSCVVLQTLMCSIEDPMAALHFW